MKLHYKNKFVNFSNEQLILMWANRQDYLPDAIAAIDEILQERNLDATHLAKAVAEVELGKAAENKLAAEPMPNWVKLLLACFPVIGILGAAVIAMLLKEKGYHQKAAEVVIWTVFGQLGWGVLLLIFS
jgi:hypothetical protein